MTRTELDDRISYCRRELQTLEAIATNCTRCEHYRHANACAKYGPIPPEFVAQGCDEWTFDDIPF